MRRTTINSFEKIRVFGEDYTIKSPSTVPRIYDLKKQGAVGHIDMQDLEWVVKLAKKYRIYKELQKKIDINISGIVIHPGEEKLDDFEDISELADLIMKVTYLESKSENQIYVLDCYEAKKSKFFVQTVCNIESKIAEPYIIKPNPIPLFDTQKIKMSSNIASAILLGVKIYLNLKRYGLYDDELEKVRCGILSEFYIKPIHLLGKDIV